MSDRVAVRDWKSAVVIGEKLGAGMISRGARELLDEN
jgi:hypothetical protein